MSSNTLAFFAQFIASKAGKDALTPTWDVERITRSDGTRSALVTGGATNITIGRRGLYGYYLAAADLDLYDYVATAITADATVDQKEIAAVWTEWILPSTAQTGDSFLRIGANGASLTALGDTRLANLDAAISTRHASGAAVAKSPATLAAADVSGNLPVDLQTIKTQTVTAAAGVTFPSSVGTSTYAGTDTAGTTTLLGIFSGITSLPKWLRGLFRKDAMDATALSEVNTGGGTFAETTDSLEAIRDTAPLGTAMRGTDGAYTGTPPSAADIADAVLDEAKGVHTGHIASIPTNPYTGTPPTAADIADAVLDEAKGTHAGFLTTLALESTLTAMKGAGWSTETLVAIDVLLDAIKAKTDLITTGTTLTIVSPVAATGGAVTIIRGDDYLSTDGRSLAFSGTTWPVITGSAIALIIRFPTVASYSGVVTGAAACYVELTKVQTAAMTPGTYDYDLQATLTDASVVTLAQSSFTVLADVR